MSHFTKSLRFKVTLLVITVELLIFSGVGFFYTHRFSQEVDNAIIARLSTPGLLMSRGELSFDAVSDKRTMERLLREPYSEGIVIGLDGQVYFSSDPARLDTHLDAINGLRLPGSESSAISADAPDLITPVQDSTGRYLTSLSPLRPNGKLTGYLYLKVGTGISEAEKHKIAILFAIGSLATITLTAAILSWLLHLMVIRRLNYQVEIFRCFAQGDYATRAQPMGGDDEIVTLMNGFNGLAKRLEDTVAHLSESESRFRVLVEYAPEAILVYDFDTKHFVDANKNAERLFACSREQLRLANPTTFYTPVLPDKTPMEQSVYEYSLRALAGEEVVIERAITNAGGQQLLCEVRLVRLPASNSRLIRASYIDITERKRAEEALRESKEELQEQAHLLKTTIDELREAQEALVRKEKLAILGQLSGSVGHELRNPLGVMSNAVYFLKMLNADADETVKEYLNIIKNEIDTSLRIITDLLDFARTKAPRIITVTVRELTDESLARCAIPENIDLQTEIPDNLPLLRIDPLQMGQVLQNLIINAVQAMPDGGALRISARQVLNSDSKSNPDKQDKCVNEVIFCGKIAENNFLLTKIQNSKFVNDFIEISVTDTGEGISPENMKKLFQPLFTTKAKGIGLGLVVCKNLVEANGGRIEVASELGKSTTFTVALPVKTENDREDVQAVMI